MRIYYYTMLRGLKKILLLKYLKGYIPVLVFLLLWPVFEDFVLNWEVIFNGELIYTAYRVQFH